MSDVQLSTGICMQLNGVSSEEEQETLCAAHPTVQILSIKKVGQSGTGNTVDRYRVIVSDGQYFLQAMLATQVNKMVEDGTLTKNSVVVIDKFTCNYVQEKKLLIILTLTHKANPTDKIGSPNALQPGGTASTPGVQKPVSSASSAVQQNVSTSANATPQAAAPSRPQQPPQGPTKVPPVLPIEGLNPYQNNWTIRARVKQKGDLRTYSNARGDGKLFNVTFMDDTGEIRGTAFNKMAEQFYDQIQEGKTYYVAKARVNLAKKKFNNVNNDYELSLDAGTTIEECLDGVSIAIKYDFVDLAKLGQVSAGAMCDVIGVVKEIAETSTITSRQNNTIVKRELTIVDQSQSSVRLTLWGKTAENFNIPVETVIAWKGVKVGDFGGRSLSMMSTSSMEINPDHPSAHMLRGWYDSEGTTQNFQSQTSASFSGSTSFNRSELQFLNDVKENELGTHDKVDYFSARATIMHIKPEPLAYPACGSEGCQKKVVQQGEGWWCEKCQRSFDRPSYRYLMSMAVSDQSGQAWLNGFNDVGLMIFGVPADELMEMKDQDEARFSKRLEGAVGAMYNFQCRAKTESFNDNTRVRYGIQKILPVDFKEEAKYLQQLLSSDWATQ